MISETRDARDQTAACPVYPLSEPHAAGHGEALVCNVFGRDLPGLNLWHVVVPAGLSMESHAHPCEEVYYVLAGRGELVVGSQRFEVQAGCAIRLPANMSHGFRNDGDDDCEIAAVSYLHSPAPKAPRSSVGRPPASRREG